MNLVLDNQRWDFVIFGQSLSGGSEAWMNFGLNWMFGMWFSLSASSIKLRSTILFIKFGDSNMQIEVMNILQESYIRELVVLVDELAVIAQLQRCYCNIFHRVCLGLACLVLFSDGALYKEHSRTLWTLLLFNMLTECLWKVCNSWLTAGTTYVCEDVVHKSMKRREASSATFLAMNTANIWLQICGI